jgi:hypothetical protein
MPKTTRIHGGIDAGRVNDLQDAGIVDQTYPRFLRVAGRHRRHLAASDAGNLVGATIAANSLVRIPAARWPNRAGKAGAAFLAAPPD